MKIKGLRIGLLLSDRCTAFIFLLTCLSEFEFGVTADLPARLHVNVWVCLAGGERV